MLSETESGRPHESLRHLNYDITYHQFLHLCVLYTFNQAHFRSWRTCRTADLHAVDHACLSGCSLCVHPQIVTGGFSLTGL